MRSSLKITLFCLSALLTVLFAPVGLAQTYCFDLSSDCFYQNAVFECMPPINSVHGTPNTDASDNSAEIQMIVTNLGPDGYRGEGIATNPAFYPGAGMDFPETVNIEIDFANGSIPSATTGYRFEVYAVDSETYLENMDGGLDEGAPEWQLINTTGPAFTLLFSFDFNDLEQNVTTNFSGSDLIVPPGTRQLYLRPVLSNPIEPGALFAKLQSICITEPVKCGEGNEFEDVDDASFEISVQQEFGSSRIITPVNYEAYSEFGPEVTHEWEVYDQFSATQFNLVGQGEGLNFIDTIDYHFTHTVVHRLITPCDTFCYASTICSIFNPNCNAISGSVDCLNTFTCKAEIPSGLRCSESKWSVNLNWSAAEGADAYEVEVYSPNPLPFQCSSSTTYYTTITDNTSIPLPSGFGICYCFRVRSICVSGSKTGWSDQYCNKGMVCGRKSLAVRTMESAHQFSDGEFSVHPNPAVEHVDISVKVKNTDYTVEIIDINGKIWHRFFITKSSSSDLSTTHGLTLDANMPSGVYIIRLNADENMYSKKLLINR